MNNRSLRMAALFAAGALACGTAPYAMAQQAGTETTPAAATVAPANLVDPNASVTLNITKYEGDPGTTTTPLANIQFKVEKVADVDLTTQEGWAAAAGLTADSATVDPAFNAVTLTTGTDGKASLSTATNPQFTVGLYKVTELQASGYTAAAPFLVALPHDENGSWSYTQDVLPKNQKNIPTKQVDDTNTTIGSTIKYTVNAPVPAGTLSRFNIVDPLNAALSVNTADVKVAATGVTLAAGTDYNVSLDSGTNTLRVDFTESGRNALQTARATNPSLAVTVEFPATLTKSPDGGVLTNTATVELPNGATTDTNGDDPSTPGTVEDNPTSTTFGELTITKTTSNGEKTLDGAEFQLFLCKPNATTPTKYDLLGDPLKVNTTNTNVAPGTTLTTTGTTGTAPSLSATAKGYAIPLQSFAAETGVTPNQYCVLETKAPAGYVANPEPQPVAIDLAAKKLTVSVDNQKNSIIGQLPATGAFGIVLVFLLGLLLLARGLYTSYKDSRATA